MDSLSAACVTLGSLLLGFLLGIRLRRRLPADHLRGDSIEFLRTALGIIATLVALVVGLLISSAKSAFDQASAEITRTGTTVILLDRTLVAYGPGAEPIRLALREMLENMLRHHWELPVQNGPPPRATTPHRAHIASIDSTLRQIRLLSPSDDYHRGLRDHALSLCDDLMDTRWLLVEQAQNPLPGSFLAILLGWLALLGLGLSLIAPENHTTLISLLICCFAMASAVFLILELNRPFEGLLQISPDSLVNALHQIGP